MAAMAPKITPKFPANAALNVEQQKEFNQKVEKLKKKGAKANHGVIYVGHIPRGFYEEEMKGYFSQFGKISRMRVVKSRKTGGPKGYAFVEFASVEVAQIVAETMNNYLMFNKLLKCHLMKPEEVHPRMFMIKKQPLRYEIAMKSHNAHKSASKETVARKKLINKIKTTISKLAEMGIEYDFPLPEEPEKPAPAESTAPQDEKADSMEEESDEEVTLKIHDDVTPKVKATKKPSKPKVSKVKGKKKKTTK